MTQRQRARAVIAPVLRAHAGESRTMQRRALRKVYHQYHSERSGYPYEIWLQEVRYALRERTRKQPLAKPSDILPSARQSAEDRGLTHLTATFDIDLF